MRERNYLLYVELPNLIHRIVMLDTNIESNSMNVEAGKIIIKEIKRVLNATLDGTYETLVKANNKHKKEDD